MTDGFLYGLLYGPSGPDHRRFKDDNWGPVLERAFDGNDNEDFIEKTRIMSKYTFAASTLFAMGDIILLNNKGGLPVALSRMKFHYVPWLGGTVAYWAAVNASCSLRGGKSDHTNHIVGGFAAGAVVGKCARHGITGALTGAFLALLGYYYKDAAMNGYEVIPDFQRDPKLAPMHGNPFSHKLDYTMNAKRLGERKGYWAKRPEDVEEVFKQGQLGDGNTTDRLW